MAIAAVALKNPALLKNESAKLMKHFNSDDENVRLCVAFALSMISPEDPEIVKEAVPILIEFLDSDEEEIQLRAAVYLAKVITSNPEIVKEGIVNDEILSKITDFLEKCL
jgi:HEAT repeat protein